MKFKKTEETVIHSREAFEAWQRAGEIQKSVVFQDVDLKELDFPLPESCEGWTFLGCQLEGAKQLELLEKGALLYHIPKALPYKPFRQELYGWRELMEGWTEEEDRSEDWLIYQHFSRSRFNPPLTEAMAQRIHDHSIDEALRSLLKFDRNGHTLKRCVGIMGGHGTLRTDPYFAETARMARLLTANGFFVVSGGGPGIMEAANLGAWMARYSEEDLEEVLGILGRAPHYKDKDYLSTAREILERYPEGEESLAIPTWFYGHEPSNLFATHIAKYFSNSIREDTLLAISLYGVVFAPGSAGTTQEIFMDATQNHYGTFNFYSPMVFLGKKRYEIDTLIFPLVKQLSFGRKYHQLIHLTDEASDVVDFLKKNGPVAVI